MADQSNIQSAASKSIRPFRSSEEYLYAMKEDLAEWFNTLYDLDIHVDNFMEALETGYDLCQHANNVNRSALEFQQQHPEAAARMRLPRNEVVFQAKNVVPGSFVARDNISNFIQWCRQDLGIQDVLMFETNDLVLKKNEKNVVLCLLEVARRGSKFGMLAPMLIQMEEEIEEEMRDQITYGVLDVRRESHSLDSEALGYPSRTQRISLCDLKNLDELVREILGCCTCPSQFPMVKVSEGKYQVGDSNALIFVRVLRSHVMVRVGGGWDTLEHYLDKHDPCRCAALAHRLGQPRAPGVSPHKGPPPGTAPSPGVPRRDRRPPGDPPMTRTPRGPDGDAAAPAGTQRLREAAPPRARRCSGDSDSSASSAQSGAAGPAAARGRREGGRAVPAGGRSQSRERGAAPAAAAARGGPGAAGRAPRSRSHGRPGGGDAVLLIRRARDGQHSWARAGGAGSSAGSRAGSPARRAPAAPRSPAPRRASLPAERHPPPPPPPLSRPRSPAPLELEGLARRLRAPLCLEPGHEQRLLRRLEEEFWANTRQLELDGDAESSPRPPPAEPPAADSAYCSSSSSSSSLSFFSKHGLAGPPGPGPDGAAGDGRWQPLSSSSDEGSYCPGVSDTLERPDAASDTELVLPEPVEDEEEEAAAPSSRRVPAWPGARPRLDTQPDKKPSRIPTPRSCRAPARDGRAAEQQPWRALHSVLASFLEPSWGPREPPAPDGGAWP